MMLGNDLRVRMHHRRPGQLFPQERSDEDNGLRGGDSDTINEEPGTSFPVLPSRLT